MGLADKQQIKSLSNTFDELCDFSTSDNFWVRQLEKVDGALFKTAFEFADEQLAKVLPKELVPEYMKFINYMINKNWIGASSTLKSFAGYYIHIKWISEGKEAIILKHINSMIVELIQYKADNE